MEICLDTRITLGTPISRYDIIDSTISSSMTCVTCQSMSIYEAPMFFSVFSPKNCNFITQVLMQSMMQWQPLLVCRETQRMFGTLDSATQREVICCGLMLIRLSFSGESVMVQDAPVDWRQNDDDSLVFFGAVFFHQFVKWVTSKTFDEASSDMSNNGSVSCFYFQRATIRWNQRKHARGMILSSKAERTIMKRWWFQILLIFTPIWWRLPFWTSIFIIFSIGLVHPPTRDGSAMLTADMADMICAGYRKQLPGDSSCHLLIPDLQESYNTPLEHTPGNPPTQPWKDSLYSLLVKV